MRVVGCFVEYDGKFLILKRNQTSPQPGKWGLPAGKVDKGETDLKAIQRELFEETGYQAKESEFSFLYEDRDNYVGYDLEFPTFRIHLAKKITVKIDPLEHDEFLWVTPQECYKRKDLVAGFQDLLEKIGWVKKK